MLGYSNSLTGSITTEHNLGISHSHTRNIRCNHFHCRRLFFFASSASSICADNNKCTGRISVHSCESIFLLQWLAWVLWFTRYECTREGSMFLSLSRCWLIRNCIFILTSRTHFLNRIKYILFINENRIECENVLVNMRDLQILQNPKIHFRVLTWISVNKLITCAPSRCTMNVSLFSNHNRIVTQNWFICAVWNFTIEIAIFLSTVM